jgi:hypothetical protein
LANFHEQKSPKMRNPSKSQSARLHAIQCAARDIRLDYQAGRITHKERMKRLEDLLSKPNPWQRLIAFARKGNLSI